MDAKNILNFCKELKDGLLFDMLDVVFFTE